MSLGTNSPSSPRGKRSPFALDAHGLSIWARLILAAVVIIAAFILVPTLDRHSTFLFGTIAVWALVACSLNLVVGYAGQLNLSGGAFLAIGAYIGVLGTGRWSWPGWFSILVAVCAAGVFAAILGLVIFRARGLHFALLTAGVSIVVYGLLVAWSSLTGGAAGISTAGPIEAGGIFKPLDLGIFELEEEHEYVLFMLIALVVLLLATTAIVRRKTGLGWQATRDDEVLAASTGVRVNHSKRTAFIVSSVLTAVVGVVFGHWLGFITPDSFTFASASFEPLAMVIIGGMGTIMGPVVGALIIAGMPELFTDFEQISTLVYGLVLLLVVLLAPAGAVGTARDGLRRFAARRRRVGSDAADRGSTDADHSADRSEVHQ